MKNVLRSLKPSAFPFIRLAFPRSQRPRPKSSSVRANLDPTACPQAGASAEQPAAAKPAPSATCLPCADSQAGRGLLTRSGNAAFRRQPPQTTQAGRGLLTVPMPDPTAARLEVAEVAKGGCVDACLPAQRRRTFYNSLSLNDPPDIDLPNINRNLESAMEVPRHQHLPTKISQTKVS